MATLPIDFWKEFDRRLDATLDVKLAKLEAKFDEKLAPIIHRLDKLDARMDKLDARMDNLDARMKHMEGWSKRQDNSLESELKIAIKTHLVSSRLGFYTVEPTVFPKEIKDENGKTLTEFDGIFILTSDKEHANSLSKYLPKHGVIDVNTEAYLFIVEAKQHVTTKKIRRKIRQMEKIDKMLQNIKEGTIPMPKELRGKGIEYIKGIGLYIGGVEIDSEGKAKMMTFCNSLPNEKEALCGIIELNGQRFEINNIQNAFGNLQFGGKKRLA